MRVGELIADRYRLKRIAGSGAMGLVYEAIDTQCDLPVAIKLADRAIGRDGSRRFSREARALAELSAVLRHPNIVDYVAHGLTRAGQPYLVMEWLTGRELKQRLVERPLGIGETISVGRQIASALLAAHGRGIIHRDIKPSNIFLVDGDIGRLKLVDFGLARMSAPMSMVTEPGRMLGTPGFMAPEQARGEKGVDVKADLYSLGAVLFTCLVGRPPFVGDHTLAILTKLQHDKAPSVHSFRGDVPDILGELIGSLLAKDPEERPVSAAEIAVILEEIHSHVASDERARTSPEIAVSGGEQRYSSVLLIGTAESPTDRGNWTNLASLADQYQADLRPLSADIAMASFSGEHAPMEAAIRAARFALSVHDRDARLPLVLATGRGVTNESRPVGEHIDRAVELLSAAASGGAHGGGPDPEREEHIVVDEVTVGLLEGRFQLRARPGGGPILVGETRGSGGVRSLFGRRTRCLGRNLELTILEAGFVECFSESSARAVLVTGPAGIGKSRLVHEFVHRIRDHLIDPFPTHSVDQSAHAGAPPRIRPGADSADTDSSGSLRVWSAYGDSLRSGSSLGLVADLIRQATGITPDAPVSVQRKQLTDYLGARLIDDHAERVAVFLGEIIGARFDGEGHQQLREAREDHRLMHDHMRQAWEDWLDAETARGPILCVLDDLQWSDVATIRFVDAALRNLADRPLMFLGLGRPETTAEFPDLWAARGLEHIVLKPLSKRACRTLAEQLLDSSTGSERSGQLIAEVVARSGGNPFYIEELARHAALGNLGRLPDTILAMVGARLQALPADHRRVMRAASTFGPFFWLGGLAELIGLAAEEVVGLVERLAELELVNRQRRSRFAGEIEYAFPHDLIREAAYATLTADDRTSAHKKAAYWLESIGETDAAVLAEHFRRGGLAGNALPYFLRAAEQALEGDDLAGVCRWAEQAIECDATGETLGRLRLLQAEAHNWRGEHELALTRAREAMSALPVGSGVWANSAHHSMWAATVVGDVDTLDTAGRLLIGQASPNSDDLYLMAMAHGATCLSRWQRSEQAGLMLETLERHTRKRTTSRPLSATTAMAYAFMHSREGRPDRCATASAKAVEHWNEVGSQRDTGLAESTLGHALYQLGEYQQSIAIIRAAIWRAERASVEYLMPVLKQNLGLGLARTGCWNEARTLCCPIEDAKSDQQLQLYGHVYLALIALWDSSPQDALRESSQALAYPEHDDILPIRAYALAIHAKARLELGNPTEALGAARTGMEIANSLGALEEGDAFVRLTHAEALHANGDLDRAHQAIRAARDRLLELAARIANPDWRKSFLERVEENRRTLELAALWDIAAGNRPAS